ncbi:MAG: PEP-CTERM sorting domain-containing protein [Tepidisphaeraceae bacterium]|jgi:hypothetical protein
MKTLYACATLIVLLAMAYPARAQFVVTFDENNVGTVTGPTIPTPIPLPADKSTPKLYPGQVLGYVPQPGDVLLLENAADTNNPSDLLRFTANDELIVYSDIDTEPGPADLADIGVPPPETGYPNITLVETDPSGGPAVEGGMNGLFGYTPSPGMPGAPPAGYPAVTYNFISDVPEPASLALLAVGALGFMMRPVRRSSK